MTKVERIIGRLSQVNDPVIEQAFSTGLTTADTPSAQFLARALLSRPGSDGKSSLIREFHRLDADIQRGIISQAAELAPAMREACADPKSQGPVNAVEIIRQSRSATMAYLAVEILRHGDDQAKAAAADCLYELAEWVATDGADPTYPQVPASEARFVMLAVQDGVQYYVLHKQQQVLLALLMLWPRPTPLATPLLDLSNHPATSAMKRILQHSDDPALGRCVPMLLSVRPLADSALLGVARLGWPLVMGQVVSRSYLLVWERLARPLRRFPFPEKLLPPQGRGDLPSSDAAIGMARWIANLSLEPAKMVEQLVRFTSLSEPRARLSVLIQLIKLSHQSVAPARQAISTFCFDEEPDLARLALRHLIAVKWDGLVRLFANLAMSPHEGVRQISSQHLAPLAFERFWESWPRLDQTQRLAAGNALIKIDTAFHRKLAQRLHRPERASRLRALSLIHGLNQGDLFEPAVLALARDPDHFVAASSMRALATVHSTKSIETLESGLGHADARVRSNAIESLQALDITRHAQKLAQIAAEDEHRPRATAIGALMDMRTEQAMSSLKTMLSDKRPDQRQGALWLVESLGLIDVARQVAEMSLTDVDVAVQTTAKEVVQKLIEKMQLNRSPGTTVKATG